MAIKRIGRNWDIPANKSARQLKKCVFVGAFFALIFELVFMAVFVLVFVLMFMLFFRWFLRVKIAFLEALLYNIRYGKEICNDSNSVYER